MSSADPPPGKVPDPLAAKGELIVRSRSEIERALRSVIAEQRPLTATPEGSEELFVSRLLHASVDEDRVLVEWSAAKGANAALLACRSVAFHCTYRDAHLHFVCAAPRDSLWNGAPAISLGFPPVLLALHRRELPRFQIPPEVPLRCELGWGKARFDARIVDISAGGLGVVIHDDPRLRLEPGIRIHGARIFAPGRAPFEVTLEVRFTRREILPDGKQRVRSGFRLEAPQGALEELARLFVQEIPG